MAGRLTLHFLVFLPKMYPVIESPVLHPKSSHSKQSREDRLIIALGRLHSTVAHDLVVPQRTRVTKHVSSPSWVSRPPGTKASTDSWPLCKIFFPFKKVLASYIQFWKMPSSGGKKSPGGSRQPEATAAATLTPFLQVKTQLCSEVCLTWLFLVIFL